MLDVRMLGELSICVGENRISDSGSRVKRSWLLLAYLICQRGRVIPPKKLIDLLWGDGSENVNPENSLRITLPRTRALLEELWPGAGHELILHREGGYTWNTEHPIRVDCDEFERLCQHSGGSRLENLQQGSAFYWFLYKKVLVTAVRITDHYLIPVLFFYNQSIQQTHP